MVQNPITQSNKWDSQSLEMLMRFAISLFLLLSFSVSSAQPVVNFFTEGEITSANTALSATYLTKEEQDVFLYTNLARMYPRKFVPFYHDYVRGRKANWSQLLKRDAYYSSLTAELDGLSPLDPLYPDSKLYELAKCWAIESGERGLTGHDRIDCEPVGRENCSYGYSKGIDIVLQLLIDQGVKSLGHRKNLLSNSKGLGVSIQPHSRYATCAVLDFGDTNDELRAIEETRRGEFPRLLAQWTGEEMKRVDQGRQLSYLNETEKEYYMYVNMMRLYPKKFKRVFLDNGPYFTMSLEEQQMGVRQSAGYIDAVERLMKVIPGQVLLPSEKTVAAGRCIGEGMNKRNKFSLNNLGCSTGQIGVSSYFPPDIYEFIITTMIEKGLKDFTGINTYRVFNKGDNFDVVVTLFN